MAPTVNLDPHYKVKGYAGSMLIGELADVIGLAAQTIRFYERSGLLPSPSREANGYRVYDETALNRLSFIRAAQAAGLTLGEIRGIVDLRDDGDVPCAHVTTLLSAKLDDVRAKRRELDELASELEHLLSRSERLDPGDCGDAEICHILTESP
jgi:MerR family mercuric resistance operon transcriptional regulator